MANNLFQNEARIHDVVLTGTVSSGDVVIFDQLLGIATIDGVSGDTIAIDTGGIYTLASITSGAFVLGEALYWDVGNSRLTNIAAGSTFIGICSVAKGSSVATAEVKLNERGVPSDAAKFILFDAGEFTTAGGDATESIPVTDALATDIVHVTIHTVGATPRVILTSLAVAGAITVVFAADPSTDHVLSYSVMRAV